MEAAVEKMEAQLEHWSREIEKLAAKTQKAGVRAKFDALMYIDELKAAHAVAQSKLSEFRAVEETSRARLEAELKSAWNDLDAAFKNLRS